MNRNLSINNLRIIIQQTIGWLPDIWHNQKLQIGETILKDVPIENGDALVIGIASEGSLLNQQKEG